MSDNKKLAEMETLFLALADKTRLRLLNLMRQREVCVQFLTEVLGESQPKISRHLAYLRNAGIVETRREGKWIHYKIAKTSDKFTALILNDAFDWLETQDIIQTDREKSYLGFLNNPNTISQDFEADTSVKANISAANNELEIFLL